MGDPSPGLYISKNAFLEGLTKGLREGIITPVPHPHSFRVAHPLNPSSPPINVVDGMYKVFGRQVREHMNEYILRDLLNAGDQDPPRYAPSDPAAKAVHTRWKRTRQELCNAWRASGNPLPWFMTP